MKIMASGPITPWEIDGETVTDFIILGSKITAEVIAAMKLKDTCSQRYYFANKGPSSEGYGFSVVMYGCECWTIKKAEH